jgi:hypothetical protein
VILLELYALVMAFLRQISGVRTDEAKYLLNIPYPHPPLVRWILHRTEFLSFQDVLWRVVFATLIVQAVWMIYEVAHGLPKTLRVLLCAMWLLSAGCIASVGTIMMAPLTALQALGFILLLTNEQEQSSGILVRLKRFVARRRYPHAFVLWCHDALSQRDERFALFVSVAWIASLFTALQALLFFPIVLLLLWRTSIPPWLRVLYFFLPIILLGAYMLRNPLLLASIGNVAAHDAADLSVIDRIVAPFSLWLFSGGIALSITGIIGMIVMRRYELLISLTLLLLYTSFSPHAYYAFLFVPLSIGGTYFLFHQKKFSLPLWAMITGSVAMGITALLWFPRPQDNVARDTLRVISTQRQEGTLLIVGPFGHEWQYYSPFSVQRYSASLTHPVADFLVCLTSCESISKVGFVHVDGVPVETYEKK